MLTHVFGEFVCIYSKLMLIFGGPTHFCGELMPISCELNKIIYSTQTRSFGRFLQESAGHPKHEIVKNMKLVRMRMQWRTTDNVTNCEIFCMRHMETYFGQGDKWDCGFKKNEVYQTFFLCKNMFNINTTLINGSFF